MTVPPGSRRGSSLRERGRVHGDEHVRGVARRGDLVVGDVDLEGATRRRGCRPGARISAGKSGSVARSLPNRALALVKRSPVSCMPSPESPAKRMMTRSSRSGADGAPVRSAVSDNCGPPPGDRPPRRCGGPMPASTLSPGRDPRRAAALGDRRLVDALDRGVERGVELLVALLGRQPLGERPREAGDHAGVAGQPLVGLLAAVATGEGHDPERRSGARPGSA